jgi:FKBP-type peptidyl-prolyl cis-trans isomerase 2
MAQARSGDTVRVHYTGRLEDGSVFDSSEGREPLEFVLGAQQVIPGFEEAVDGLSPGEERSVSIPADRAYGPRREEMVLTVGRDQFPDEIQPEVGQQLQMSQDGQVAIVTITGVSDADVTLDANHPLAGKDLLFDVQLVEIV